MVLTSSIQSSLSPVLFAYSWRHPSIWLSIKTFHAVGDKSLPVSVSENQCDNIVRCDCPHFRIHLLPDPEPSRVLKELYKSSNELGQKKIVLPKLSLSWFVMMLLYYLFKNSNCRRPRSPTIFVASYVSLLCGLTIYQLNACLKNLLVFKRVFNF